MKKVCSMYTGTDTSCQLHGEDPFTVLRFGYEMRLYRALILCQCVYQVEDKGC